MIKLQFSALSNQDSSFKNTFFSQSNDDYLIPAEKDIINVQAEWNGETNDIQHIIYDSYTCEFFYRDEQYKDIQKIRSASQINIWEIGEEKRFDGERFELIEFASEIYANEFWKITLTLRNVNSKLIENIIFNKISDTLVIWNQETNLFSTNIPFDCIDKVDFVNNLADDFSDKITDYNKKSTYKEVRFYLNNTDLALFYDELENVGPYSVYKILYKSINFYQYEITQEPVGNNLFQMTLKLYSENKIIVPET